MYDELRDARSLERQVGPEIRRLGVNPARRGWYVVVDSDARLVAGTERLTVDQRSVLGVVDCERRVLVVKHRPAYTSCH